jgi:hypothetical protein
MPLRVCVPCEKLFLFDEDGPAGVPCPRCGVSMSQPSVQAMTDLPRYPIELVGRKPSGRSNSALPSGSIRA